MDTKLHWYPRLEVRPTSNLLVLICFVGPIDSGSHLRDVGQLVLGFENEETIGTTKVEQEVRNYGFACIYAPTMSLIDFLLPRNICHVKGRRSGICNFARKFLRMTP